MRARQIYILVAVLAVLSILAYVAHESKKPPESPPAESEQAKLFPSLKADNIAVLKIKSLGSEAQLVRDEAGTWVVPDKHNYPAEASAIQRMLEAIETLDRGTVVSRNPEKQSLYEVDETTGTEVTALGKEQNELAHFFVGKAGQDFFSTNVRLAGENEVRLVRKMLSYMFKRPGGDWREKLIFDLDEAKIVKYSVTGEEGVASFEKNKLGTWATIEPAGKEAMEQKEIKSSVSSLAKLRASGFAEEEDKDKLELDKPKWTITVSTTDGEELTLKVCGEKSKAQYYVQRADKDTVFYIGKYQVEKMNNPYREVLGMEKKPQGGKKPDKKKK